LELRRNAIKKVSAVGVQNRAVQTRKSRRFVKAPDSALRVPQSPAGQPSFHFFILTGQFPRLPDIVPKNKFAVVLKSYTGRKIIRHLKRRPVASKLQHKSTGGGGTN
jgi:hypothetical protein